MYSNAVFGIDKHGNTARIVDALTAAGFPGQAISVLFLDNEQTRQFANRKHTKAPDGTAFGATAHIELDGRWGIMDPAAGPVMGALPGALAGMGIPDDDAESYGDLVKAGAALLSVRCRRAGEALIATIVLGTTGAERVVSREEPAAAISDGGARKAVSVEDGADLRVFPPATTATPASVSPEKPGAPS